MFEHQNKLKDSFVRDDPWAYFWSEAMIWIIRLSCYAANYLFFLPLYSLTDSRLFADIGIFVWSAICYESVWRLVVSRFKPSYAALELTEEEYAYRINGERVLLAAGVCSLLNALLGVTVALVTSQPDHYSLVGFGLVGMIFGTLSTLMGVVFLVAKSAESNKRGIFPAILGPLFFVVPSYFIYYAISVAW